MATEEQIRHLAHAIWEKEGCPEGKADEHWHRAKQSLEDQEVRADRRRLAAAIVVGLVLITLFSWADRRSGSFQWWHVSAYVIALIVAVLVKLIPAMGRPLKHVNDSCKTLRLSIPRFCPTVMGSHKSSKG